MSKHTTEAFIEKAKAVHGDKYNYKEVVYEGAQKKVVIYCDVHGRFEIEANSHLKGNGCKVCSCPERYESFDVKAKKIHGGRYDYTETIYLGNKHNVTVRCREHGLFEIAPVSHLNGIGCKECLRTVKGKRPYRRLSNNDGRFVPLEQHLEECSVVHSNKYDYSKVVFKNVMTPVEIVCPEHGSFYQAIYSHKVGKGCSLCAKSGFNKAKNGTFYVLLISNGTSSFIGYGISNVYNRRMVQHRCNTKNAGYSIIPIATFNLSGKDTYDLEQKVKSEVPLYETTIQGFITESTSTTNLDLVLSIASDFVGANT